MGENLTFRRRTKNEIFVTIPEPSLSSPVNSLEIPSKIEILSTKGLFTRGEF